MALAAVPLFGEKYKDAESAARQVMLKAEVIIGRNDPEIMNVVHLSATMQHAQGKSNEAKEYRNSNCDFRLLYYRK